MSAFTSRPAGRLGAAAVAIAALLLTACVADPEHPGGPGGPGGEPGGAAASTPMPLIELDCEAMLSAADLTAAMGAQVPATAVPRDGLGGLYEFTQDGTLQAGALQCSWGDGDDAESHYLDVTVLPNAASAWNRYEADVRMFQPREGDWGEASWLDCSTSSATGCRADVLVNDRWLNVRGWGLPGEAEFSTVMSRLVEVIGQAPAREAEWSHDSPAAASCDSVLTVDQLSAAVGDELQVWQNRPVMIQPVIFAAGFEQAGGVVCSWWNNFGNPARTVEVGLLPGGAWAWQSHYAVPPRAGATRTEVADLGDRGMVTLLQQSENSYGYASMLLGEDWVDVSVNLEHSDDDAEVAEALARLIAAG